MWTVACFFYGQWRWYMYSHSNPQKNTLHRYHLSHIWEIILYYYTEHTLGIVFQFAMTTYSHLERLTTVNNAHEKLWLANQLHYTYLGKEWGFRNWKNVSFIAHTTTYNRSYNEQQFVNTDGLWPYLSYPSPVAN